MEKTIWKRATTPSFWQGYFRWYQQWMAHSHYHDGIVRTITSMARPTWRVLDIGAGNGVLSRPLARMGCEVTALEPSSAMRHLLRREAVADQCDGIHIDGRRWETVRCEAFRGYDLILACNTLHLTQIGFARALAKVFATEPKRIVVVTEFFSPEMRIPARCGNYHMAYVRIEQAGSSFAYHSQDEAMEHWSANTGRRPDIWEKAEIKSKLVRRGDHLWMGDSAFVGVFCWKAFQ
jgi:SAM-dependent methyltransferase